MAWLHNHLEACQLELTQICHEMQVGYADASMNLSTCAPSSANDEFLKQRLAAIAPVQERARAAHDDLRDIGLM